MAKKVKPTTKENSTLAELVRDKELLQTFEQNPDQACTVIVQAKLPKRKFTFGRSGSKNLVRGMDSKDSKDERNRVLEELMKRLVKIVGSEHASLLKSAGSIVVTTTPRQLEEISKIENIEAIWENRELGLKKKPGSKK